MYTESINFPEALCAVIFLGWKPDFKWIRVGGVYFDNCQESSSGNTSQDIFRENSITRQKQCLFLFAIAGELQKGMLPEKYVRRGEKLMLGT
jgi:hypothetical protein